MNQNSKKKTKIRKRKGLGCSDKLTERLSSLATVPEEEEEEEHDIPKSQFTKSNRSMASLAREWVGFKQFPVATQDKLVDLFGKLKEQGIDTLTILVMGKGGVGKSSTVNSLIGERVMNVNSFQADFVRPVMVSRLRAGFTINIIDTPGLVEGGYVNYPALELTKRFLLNKKIDVLLYVDRLDSYRVDELDKQIVKAIADGFGKDIWRKSLLVLTHAQLCPPDDISYDVFTSRRSEAVMKTVMQGARLKKSDLEEQPIPVGLVENSGRCNKNDSDEKILPNGDAWIPSLVEQIITTATNGSKSVVVDKKLIDGSASSDRGKLYIPILLAAEVRVILPPSSSLSLNDLSIFFRD
ncbi:Translocase of chloroplast 33, chloroplastic [Linum perenne]